MWSNQEGKTASDFCYQFSLSTSQIKTISLISSYQTKVENKGQETKKIVNCLVRTMLITKEKLTYFKMGSSPLS